MTAQDEKLEAVPYIRGSMAVHSTRWSRLFAVLLVLFIPLAEGTSAQRGFADTPSCGACSVRFDVQATLGEIDGPGALTGASAVVQDARGRYWVLDQPPALVFGPDGRFLRTVGRAGDGPGEFRAPLITGAAVGDSVVVFDGRGRATVFDSDFNVVRTARLPVSVNVGPRWTSVRVLRWPDAVVINASVSQAQGRSFHLADLSSTEPVLIESFGGEDPHRLLFLTRLLSLPVAGRFWAADRVWYRLQQWDAEGNRINAFRRTASWFPDFVQGGPLYGPNTPPIPMVDAVAQDSRGRLWVFLSVAAPNWKQLIEGACPGSAPERACAPPEGIYEYRVEVIDPSRGLVARGPSKRVIAPLPGGRVAAYSEDGLIPRLEILTMELVEPR